MDRSVFDTLRHLPDLMISASDQDHYLPFEEAMLQDTTNKDCPSLQQRKKKKSISFSPSVQHVNNVSTLMQCEECQMWRLLFSKRKLTIPQRRTLERTLADIVYSCGATLEDLVMPPELSTVCVRDHQCGDPMEKLYYSAGYDPVCYYCASENVDDSIAAEFYPMCTSCVDKECVRKRKK